MENEDTDPRGDSNDSISDMLIGPALANTLKQWVKGYARDAKTNKSIITCYLREAAQVCRHFAVLVLVRMKLLSPGIKWVGYSKACVDPQHHLLDNLFLGHLQQQLTQ